MSPQEEPQGTRRIRREPGVPQTEVSSSETLPLRLSVARGGLGVELNREIRLGSVTCTELSLSLLGVSYPVDLSKGVKQFCSHRTALCSASVRIDLPEVAKRWALSLAATWGELPTVGIQAVLGNGRNLLESAHRADLDGSTANAAVTKATSTEAAVANESGQVEALSIHIQSARAALAFDLVIAPGKAPGLVLDAARSYGELAFVEKNSATRAALLALELGFVALGAGELVVRRGRVVQLQGLARALCLNVLPQLGFRLPSFEQQVLLGIDMQRGDLCLELGQFDAPFQAGARALSLVTLADIIWRADDALAQGRIEDARAAYLNALAQAQAHPLLLLELADLDLRFDNRAESALAFLEESEVGLGTRLTEQRSRLQILQMRALALAGRREAAAEALRASLETERDAAIFAHLCCAASKKESDPALAKKWLDRAVARAPMFAYVRSERLRRCLSLGQLNLARADAEQLDALETDSASRAELAVRLAEAFREAGYEEEATSWLKRALRFNPDDAQVMVRLAERFAEAGQELRGAELLSSAVRTLEARAEQLQTAEIERQQIAEERATLELLREARFALAELLIKLNTDFSTALALLGAIDTRSEWGAYARVLEAEIHQQLKSPSARDRSLVRLVEAAELGWLDPKPVMQRYRRLLQIADPPVELKLQEFAEAR